MDSELQPTGPVETTATETSRLVARWRETADIWEQRIKDGHASNRRAEKAPQPGRGAIENWINWLRNCAKSAESAAAADTDGLREALTRIAESGPLGGAWCVAVAREALGLPALGQAQPSDAEGRWEDRTGQSVVRERRSDASEHTA